ncbi:hypothetical protein F0562_008881 [Nyssa sinensis]|uniref:Apple domain-containing protein n=1 Tax=Nyssa sinensis TaxID=561372 RepID=A0A5J5A8R0_9ASTE|nr:hypothetical protein F0562_008881 [Nyssa sinensis]
MRRRYILALTVRVVSRVVLDQNGRLQGFIWSNQSHRWSLYSSAQTDNCDNYASCGVYGSCKGGISLQCQCVTGFVPKFPKEWEVADWSNGCVRRTQLDCQNGDGFLKYSGIKLPATRNSWSNRSLILEECKMECLKNCSCVAYANLEIRKGGSGCLLWFGDLIDIKEFNQNGQDIYIRLASSEIGQLGSSKKKKLRYIAGSVPFAIMLLLGLSLTLCLRRKNKLQRQGGTKFYQHFALKLSNYKAERILQDF